MIRERKEIEAAKKDPENFRVLYKRYHEQIFRYVYQRVSDVDDAKDVVSQVFLKAMMNLHKFEYRGFPFSAWLYRIAMSETANIFNRNKGIRTINMDESEIPELMSELEEDHSPEREEMLIHILRELPENDLQLIEMRFFEKRRYADIGEVLEITKNNAKVKVYRILERMKKQVKELKR